jgi:hypothetical protein
MNFRVSRRLGESALSRDGLQAFGQELACGGQVGLQVFLDERRCMNDLRLGATGNRFGGSAGEVLRSTTYFSCRRDAETLQCVKDVRYEPT